MNLLTEFTPYVGLAVLLYVIRQTQKVPNKYIPIVAVVLGVLYASWEAAAFTPAAFLNGLQYAALGIATVASIKYYLEKDTSPDKPTITQNNHRIR